MPRAEILVKAEDSMVLTVPSTGASPPQSRSWARGLRRALTASWASWGEEVDDGFDLLGLPRVQDRFTGLDGSAAALGNVEDAR
jgi:hypothetical protein